MGYFIEPFHRMFFLDDLSKSYPHALIERVPPIWLFVYGGGIPLFVMIVWLLIARHRLHQAHVTLLGLFISLALTMLLTNIVKNSVGRPRPDLIARCKPREGTPARVLLTIDVCTETAPVFCKMAGEVFLAAQQFRFFWSGLSGIVRMNASGFR